MKFGVIGYGSIGQRHVKNLISLGYSQISLMREIGNDNEYGLKEFNTLNDLLDWEPDAIILCNPSSMHSKFLNKLILSDINILSEKPMVTTNDEIDELKKILKNYNGIGMLAYNLRYHPCIKRVRDTLISIGWPESKASPRCRIWRHNIRCWQSCDRGKGPAIGPKGRISSCGRNE